MLVVAKGAARGDYSLCGGALVNACVLARRILGRGKFPQFVSIWRLQADNFLRA